MNTNLLYPMAAMVLLTAIVLFTMFRGRVRAVKTGEADARFYKTYQEGSEPREVAQLSRNLANLFEAPTLFYVACITGMVTGYYPTVLVWLAWAYVVLRHAHSWIHVGRNKIPNRLAAYFISWLVLLAMWAVLVAGAIGNA